MDMHKGAPKYWTKLELAILKEYYNVYTPTELVELTTHPVSSVHTKIKALDLVLTERTCRQCGELFMPIHRGHIYCCKRCKGRAYRARKLLDV